MATLGKRSHQRRKGQGMTEYIICVGLIAILIVGAVSNFKNTLNEAFEKGSKAIQQEVSDTMN